MSRRRETRIWEKMVRRPSKVEWRELEWFLKRLEFSVDTSGGGSHFTVSHPASERIITVVRPHGGGESYVGAHYVRDIAEEVEDLDLFGGGGAS